MQLIGAVFVICLFLAVPAQAQPALPSFGGAPTAHHTQAKLVLSADSARPGDTIWAGVDMKMEAGWHTYWKNPGAAGLATKIDWQLPPGVAAGQFQWPLPDKFPPVEVTTYGYETEVMLLVPLTLASNLPAGPLDLKANVTWLECKDVCIPASQAVEATLSVGSETKASADAAAIESWKAKVPSANGLSPVTGWWEKAADGDLRPLIINYGPVEAAKNLTYDSVDFFPDASDNFEVQAPTDVIDMQSAFIRLGKTVKKFSGDWPKEISGVIVTERANQRYGYQVTLPIADTAPAGEAISAGTTGAAAVSGISSQNPETGGRPALPLMLLYAFIGGLILNVMPCVLPVIALKILGFVREAGSEPRHVRNLGLIYALGVLVSFLALAGMVIGVEAAGHRAGWGMQFGSPVFVVCLATLVMLVALNLFGVFEVTPGGRALDAAGKLASRHGAPGAFFNGVLATTLATPCTAPFLAPALGFRVPAKQPVVIALIFLFVGLGLAAPYVVLSCNPGAAEISAQTRGVDGEIQDCDGLSDARDLGVAFQHRHRRLRRTRFLAGGFSGGRRLRRVDFWRICPARAQRPGHGARGSVDFADRRLCLRAGKSAGLARNERRNGRGRTDPIGGSALTGSRGRRKPSRRRAPPAGPVLVDFTARWCVTCNAIVKPAIENDAVAAKLRRNERRALLADYTRTPPEITAEIARHGGAGVPLVLVYPKDPGAAPMVLPQPSPLQLPSGYRKIVLAALDRAAR